MAHIFVSKEASDPRVAATPDSVAKLIKAGHTVTVQKDAGAAARIPDAEYQAAGATVGSAASKADVILAVRRPKSLKAKKGTTFVCIADPFGNEAEIHDIAKTGVTLFALDLAPRTTRAQAMDVLSSQANLAGYQAIVDAAQAYDRALPLMMTAAGTVPAARVFVMGAGVAGLQAIATARRLGAVVTATDVRAAAQEQVESLGAKFVMTEALKDASGTGGYARELTDEETAAQNELVAGHIAKQDIVVTTALIPGRPAPRLVSKAMLKSMKPGSVVVDLALERGGNVEGVKEGVNETDGVTTIAHNNVPGRLAASASALYARNVAAFLALILPDGGNGVSIDMDDDIVAATLVARDGSIVNERVAAGGRTAKPDAGAAKPRTVKPETAKPKAGEPAGDSSKAAKAKAAGPSAAKSKTAQAEAAKATTAKSEAST